MVDKKKTTKSKEESTPKARTAKPASETKKKVSAAAKETADKKTAPEDKPAAAKKAKLSTPPAPRSPFIKRTFFAKPGQVPTSWRLVDATGIPLGRLSSHIAQMLMGKDKAQYTRSAMTGDAVVVINAAKVMLTGKKFRDKVYHHHTGYPGGLKTTTARELMAKRPEELIERAVYGMLPKGHMGREWYGNLKVYAGAEHPHAAQKPEIVKLPDLGFWERV